MSARSNSEIAPRIWTNIRPTAVAVSTPWSSTTKSTWRCWRVRASSMRCSSERPSRSSLVTTSSSPARATSSARSSLAESRRHPPGQDAVSDEHSGGVDAVPVLSTSGESCVDSAGGNESLVAHSWPELTPYCLLYTSDAADEEDSVDLGGRRIIKK